MSRRDFLRLLGGTAVTALACRVAPRPRSATTAAPIAAVAFDLFTIFDPRSVLAVAEELVPGDGPGFVETWRARQFQYAWLRSAADQYRDFRQITRDAAIYAARARQHRLDDAAVGRLVDANEQLAPWPDAAATLAALRGRGLRLVTLANFTLAMQRVLLGRVGLVDAFDRLISTDEIRAYKPEPRAYKLGVDRLDLPRDRIAFAAFGGWDAAGAAWFGYPTFWVNRLGVPDEELAVQPEATGPSLVALDAWIGARR